MNLKSSANFSHMKYYLDCGFSLLIYGVGSKRELINTFVTTSLVNEPCLIVNGFHTATSLKSITNPMLKFINKHMCKIKVGGSL